MKKLFVMLFVMLLQVYCFPQGETLIHGKIESGGYGAVSVKFSNVNNKFATFIGGYGGWLINHTFLVGAGGYGLVNTIRPPSGSLAVPLVNIAIPVYYPLEKSRIQFGYGGLYLEYIDNPQSLVHFTFSTLIGAGAVTYTNYNSGLIYYSDNGVSSVVFVLEPSLNAELNVASFFRINAGIGYRFISGVDIAGLTNSDLSSIEATLSFKFGKF